jgi:hypothetical protein
MKNILKCRKNIPRHPKIPGKFSEMKLDTINPNKILRAREKVPKSFQKIKFWAPFLGNKSDMIWPHNSCFTATVI